MKKRNFIAEFKRESAQLIVNQKYKVAYAAEDMELGISTKTIWDRKRADGCPGKTPKRTPIT
ncbi:IS911 transposase [Escherichia coli]|nr:IS911 transposase [Escherichia coli]